RLSYRLRGDLADCDVAVIDPPALDTEGIFEATIALPEQIEAAVKATDGVVAQLMEAGAGAGAGGRSGRSGPDGSWVQQVVVFGLGGSGIGGDILVATAGTVLPVPVVVV